MYALAYRSTGRPGTTKSDHLCWQKLVTQKVAHFTASNSLGKGELRQPESEEAVKAIILQQIATSYFYRVVLLAFYVGVKTRQESEVRARIKWPGSCHCDWWWHWENKCHRRRTCTQTSMDLAASFGHKAIQPMAIKWHWHWAPGAPLMWPL